MAESAIIQATMPSPVGHALAGLAVAWGADLLPGPSISSSSPRLALTCATLAALPDIDLLLPIAHRTATHSLTAVAATGLLVILATGVTGKVTTRITLACMAAVASHLLLDWMAVDWTGERGLQLLWPFSDRWFISGWDVFRGTERRHIFSVATLQTNLAAVAQEIAILAPVALAAWLVRVKTLARLAAEMPGSDHPA
jgi:hypothetical protein